MSIIYVTEFFTRTFQDISNPDLMYMKCEEICDALAEDAKRASVQGYTITLKIKLATFEVIPTLLLLTNFCQIMRLCRPV